MHHDEIIGKYNSQFQVNVKVRGCLLPSGRLNEYRNHPAKHPDRT